jgi:hypothetical protein
MPERVTTSRKVRMAGNEKDDGECVTGGEALPAVGVT